MVHVSEQQVSDISEKVVIATTTFYNPDSDSDVIRAAHTSETIRGAVELGYAVVVVDGGSPDDILRGYEDLGAMVHTQTGATMGLGRRQAVQLAVDTGRPIVAWTEPEKTAYIPHLHLTAQPVLDSDTDLVVPRRMTMYSYPAAQQSAEQLGNSFSRAVTGHDLDMWFGPRTWRREVSCFFLDYDGRYGDKWDSIFIPVLDALADGATVDQVPVEYTHPADMTSLEEEDVRFYWKRMEQLQNLMCAIEDHWRELHSDS
jgi:hypothetical protein